MYWVPSVKLKKLKNKRPTWCHLLFYFTSYVLNMFRILIYPSSGVCDYSVELPHWSYCSWFEVSACNTDTIPTQPHRNSNTHRTKNNTTNVVIQQNSRKLLMMDILMSEKCWAHKKWNKIARVVLQPATRIPLQPNHTETPTHIELRTIRPMWKFNRIVASFWWWIY